MSHLSKTTHRLGRTDFLRLQGKPVCLFAESGTLWITQDGEPDDVELEAGQWRRFDGHARLIVGSLGGAARLRVTRQVPARAAWMRRAARWLAHVPGLYPDGART